MAIAVAIVIRIDHEYRVDEYLESFNTGETDNDKK